MVFLAGIAGGGCLQGDAAAAVAAGRAAESGRRVDAGRAAAPAAAAAVGRLWLGGRRAAAQQDVCIKCRRHEHGQSFLALAAASVVLQALHS